jgi:hypothetical protein
MKIRLLLIITALQFYGLIYAQLSNCVAPLKVGNYWKYYEPPLSGSGESTFSFEITDSALLPNGNYYYGEEYAYYRLREDGYYVQYNDNIDNLEWIYYKKNAKLGDTWQQDNIWGITFYTSISDTFTAYVLGKIVKVKQVDITDSLIAGGTEFWTEEFGLVDLRHEFFFFHIIGAVINDTAYGDTTSIGIYNEEIVLNEYHLLQNYPNPFNPTTTISFDLPEEANISLKVYDMLGAEVATLSEGHMLAGRHTVNFNGSNLASGIYIYKFNATSLENGKHFQKINKMLLLK